MNNLLFWCMLLQTLNLCSAIGSTNLDLQGAYAKHVKPWRQERKPLISLSADMTDPDPRPLILVVEDEGLVRMTLVDVLEDAGFKVMEAVHADEALRVLKAVSDIQAVVTDVEMPRGSINGFELAWRVRKDWQEIGVLIASGRAAPNPGDVPDGALFIGKPIHPGTLIQLIRSLLNSAQ